MIKFALLTLVVLLGHLGWWIFCYNRINSTSLPRRFIKRCEVLIIALIITIPVIMAATHWQALQQLAQGHHLDRPVPVLTFWSIWSIGCVMVLGPLWLESRFWLIAPKNLDHHQIDRVDVRRETGQQVTGKWIARAAQKLPLNEITQLSVTRKTLRLEREFPFAWQRLTIGHMSDLHFTGQLTPAYYHYVVDRMLELQPDLLVITGDIIDKDYCLDWIEPILGRLYAPLGRFFLFGNHECRLSSIQAAAERMQEIGWFDLGQHDSVVDPQALGLEPSQVIGRPRLTLVGTELPWYQRHVGDYWERGPLNGATADHSLRLGLTHSPDQHPWARRLQLDLLLAGHTHGGQVRIPGVGPLVSPSRYGSKFASGVFRLPPTLMHVSRGLAGTQPLRWRCPPEISLLSVEPMQPLLLESVSQESKPTQERTLA